MGLADAEIDLICQAALSMDIAIQAHANAKCMLELNLQHPGCVVTELDLPGESGLELLAELKRQKSSLCPIVVSNQANVDSVVRAMKLGASMVVELPLPTLNLRRDLKLAIESSERTMQRKLEQQEIRERFDRLHEDERLILDHIVNGMKNAAIARRLDVSLRTIELRRQQIYLKLGARSIAELVRIAILSREVE